MTENLYCLNCGTLKGYYDLCNECHSHEFGNLETVFGAVSELLLIFQI